MAEQNKAEGYSSVGIKTPTLERLKDYKRTMSHHLHRDMTLNDVISELMDAYAREHQEVRVA
jgi:hypothetical protein